jgi:hypothetical protein
MAWDATAVHTVHRLIPAMYSLCKQQAYSLKLGKTA